jgi:hypothetical protein
MSEHRLATDDIAQWLGYGAGFPSGDNPFVSSRRDTAT